MVTSCDVDVLIARLTWSTLSPTVLACCAPVVVVSMIRHTARSGKPFCRLKMIAASAVSRLSELKSGIVRNMIVCDTCALILSVQQLC